MIGRKALGSVLRFSLFACVAALLVGCPQRRERDPLTETNLPRPTNEVAEKIPWVTNPPPR